MRVRALYIHLQKVQNQDRCSNENKRITSLEQHNIRRFLKEILSGSFREQLIMYFLYIVYLGDKALLAVVFIIFDLEHLSRAVFTN